MKMKRVQRKKTGENAKMLREGGGGEGNFPENQVMIWCTFIPVVFICQLSQGFIIIYSAELLWHIWRLPLNVQPITVVELCVQLWIHSLPRVAIHIKTSKDMRGRAHIKAWWCLTHLPAHLPIHPTNHWFILRFFSLPVRSFGFIKRGAEPSSGQIWTETENIPASTEAKKKDEAREEEER